jgi:hypothetical protein
MSSPIRRLRRAILAVGIAVLAMGAISGTAQAASRDQTPTFPNDVSPAGLRAIASQTHDPALRERIGSLLPEGAREAAQAYVQETRSLGLTSRSGRVSVLASPTNVHANSTAGDRIGETQSEISVACFGDTVVVGWNDSQGFLGAPITLSSFSYSTNGGASFTDGGNVPLAAAGDQSFGDTGLDTDERGNWYLNSIYTRTSPSTQQDIGVHHGRFNGSGVLVWDTPVMASIGTTATGNLDKCLLACDRVTGNVYVSYTRFTANPQIEIVRSTTLGLTWGSAIILDSGTTPTSSKQAARPFCGPGGEVYVVWEKGANSIFCPDGSGNISSFNAQIGFTRSLDFGATYSPVSIIGSPVTDFLAASPGDLRERGNEFPDIAVDRSGLSTNGNLYVTWHDGASWTTNTSAGPVKAETGVVNNNPGTPDMFVIGDDVTGSISPAGDLDYWQFSATQGQNLIIDVLPQGFVCGVSGTTRQMRVRLFATQSPYPNPTGFPDSLLAGSFIGSFENRIIWTAPKTGTYLIRLQISGGTTTGTYTMRVRPVTFTSTPARDARDIVVVRSTNQGSSFTSPQLVNDDPAGLENTRPYVSVDARGHVHVFWHDHRNPGLGSNACLTSTYGTTSRDGGATWMANYPVSDELSFFSLNSLAVPNLGDYNQSASSGLVTHPAWSDQRISTGDVRTPGTNTYTAGTGPEAYTTRVIFNLSVTGPGTVVSPSSSASLVFTIKNEGTIPDTYNWVASDTQGWLTGTTSGSTGVLQPGQSTTVKVSVTSTGCSGASDVVTLTATPVGDADDSKSASSTVHFPARIGPVSTSTYICPSNPCVTIPVNLNRSTTDPVLGYSVTFQLTNLRLCSPSTSDITEGNFLSASGTTIFNVIDNGGGSYTVDDATVNCGPTGSGNLFNVSVTSTDPGGTGSLTITSVKLRNCSNTALAVEACGPGTVPIDNQAPSVTVISPNGGESWLIGTTQNITWTATDNTSVASIDIAYSTDGGATYPNVIATGIGNSGSFAWTVPNTPTTTARVRVTAHDGACNTTGFDDSDANFTIRDPVIVASAGAGGTISPSGSVSVPYGTNQTFTISPSDKCSYIVDVLVDGVSVGPVNSYTFTNVTTDHTIAASFGTLGPFTITSSANAGGTITPNGVTNVPCGGSQTYSIAVSDKCHTLTDVKVDGVSVGPVTSYTFTDVQANHTIEAVFSGYGPFTITASAGTGGTITPSGAVVVNCGDSQTFTIAADPCYSIADVLVDGVSQGPITTYTFTDVQANHTIAASFTANPLATSPVTNLAAAQVRTGNDGDGTTKITITYTTPAGAASVEVWRKGFGSYPTYDNGGGSVPPTPGSYPPAGWTLTPVTASGQADEPSTRDFWYYVAYAKDACGNTAGVSNRTNGNLNYHLGDVTDGFTPGQGNNVVNTADISLLGMHYGLSGGALAGYEYLDVGPTTDHSVNARPTTDTKTDFEDLVMFALNYFPAASLAQSSGVLGKSASQNLISLETPILVSAGQVFEVNVRLSGTGQLQALSAALDWNRTVVEPLSVSTGDLFSNGQGVVFSPGPGQLDAVLLGIGDAGITGEGIIAKVQFRAVTSGDPGISVERVIGRDSENSPVTVNIGVTGVLHTPVTQTMLAAPMPNPSRGKSFLKYSLAKSGAVELSIYSVDGRRVRTLARGVQEAGAYQSTWDGTDDHGNRLRSGVYYVRLDAAGVRASRAITLMN